MFASVRHAKFPYLNYTAYFFHKGKFLLRLGVDPFRIAPQKSSQNRTKKLSIEIVKQQR